MTVNEALKASGFTDDEIAKLDARAITTFTNIISTAETLQQTAARLREEAALDRRAQQDMWETQIDPALAGWANEKAALEAQIAFYKTQAESAKGAGFIPKDAPGFTPTPRDANGQFVAGANPVPGSPAYLTPAEGITAVSNVTWVMAEHQRLYGEPIPDDFETLMKESVQQHMPFRDYANRKYKFGEKKAEIAAKKQQEVIDAKVKEAVAARDKEWAEKGGNNPNVRQGGSSQFPELQKAVKANTRRDPTSMSKEERSQYTRELIHQEIAANSGAVN